jgi:hypothetical protein
MRRLKSRLGTACAGVLLAASLSTAQTSDRSTLVTVSGPVSLPGVTLPAGTYLFRLADSQASRNVVQIFDRDRTKIVATLLAIPAERTQIADETVITFKETPSDRPPAIRYWYYASEKSGQEFAHPKAQAIEIARASGEPVMAYETATNDIEAMRTAEMSRVEVTIDPAETAQPSRPPTEPATPPPAATPTREQPATRPPAAPMMGSTPSTERPAGTSGQMAPRATAPAETPAQPPATPTEMPRTASELAMVGLLGFLALGGAFAARALRRRLIV